MLTINLCSAEKVPVQSEGPLPSLSWARIPAQVLHEFSRGFVGQEGLQDCIWVILAAIFICSAHHPLFSIMGMCLNFSSSAGRQGMACSSSVTSMYFLILG